jgi:hypothetical protein
VRTLWFQSRINQPLFEAACRVPHLEGLWIKWSGDGINSLEPLEGARSLRYLHIGSASQVTDLTPLEHLPKLEVLELEAFKRIHDLTSLERLRGLQHLGFTGSVWHLQKVDSVEPISWLRALRYLDITAVAARDRQSLRHIAKLENLEHLEFAGRWPEEDKDFLRQQLPRWRYPASVRYAQPRKRFAPGERKAAELATIAEFLGRAAARPASQKSRRRARPFRW